jgi:hypothetical protein
MIVDNESYSYNKKDEIVSEVSEVDELLVNPGSAYLKIMQYYTEEKMLNKVPNKIENWEKFIPKYFSEKVEMTIKVFDKDDLFYEISNIVLI